MSQVPLWDAFSADYDRFVNWEGRLARELPFLETLLAQHGARSVLDVACGTGHHAIALAQRGYEVTGTDVSEGMVSRARENAGAAGVSARFRQVGFGELSEAIEGSFDTILCLGNSLPSIVSEEDLGPALADMAHVLRPGGLLIVQNLNYDRVWPRRERFMPLESYRQGQEEWLFFRFVDFRQETLTFNMVVMLKRRGTWDYWVGSTELRPIFAEELLSKLRSAGFGGVETYGDYVGSAYDRDGSGDLIVVAQKGAEFR